jgi:hypothetical protein
MYWFPCTEIARRSFKKNAAVVNGGKASQQPTIYCISQTMMTMTMSMPPYTTPPPSWLRRRRCCRHRVVAIQRYYFWWNHHTAQKNFADSTRLRYPANELPSTAAWSWSTTICRPYYYWTDKTYHHFPPMCSRLHYHCLIFRRWISYWNDFISSPSDSNLIWERCDQDQHKMCQHVHWIRPHIISLEPIRENEFRSEHHPLLTHKILIRERSEQALFCEFDVWVVIIDHRVGDSDRIQIQSRKDVKKIERTKRRPTKTCSIALVTPWPWRVLAPH